MTIRVVVTCPELINDVETGRFNKVLVVLVVFAPPLNGQPVRSQCGSSFFVAGLTGVNSKKLLVAIDTRKNLFRNSKHDFEIRSKLRITVLTCNETKVTRMISP